MRLRIVSKSGYELRHIRPPLYQSVCLSVCPHVPSRPLLNGLIEIWYWGLLWLSVEKLQSRAVRYSWIENRLSKSSVSTPLKQKLSNTARCLEKFCYILKYYVLTLHFYYNFNPNILVIPYILGCYKELIDTRLSFTDIRHAAYALVIMYLPDDG